MHSDFFQLLRRALLSLLCLTCSMTVLAQGQEVLIRKNLQERIPQFPKIDEVTKAAMPGLYEIRVDGTEIYYTDAEANFLIQGQLIDTRSRRNITEERVGRVQVTIEISDLKHLERVIKSLRDVDGVLDVERAAGGVAGGRAN
mgnify:CR=1 FL=1